MLSVDDRPFFFISISFTRSTASLNVRILTYAGIRLQSYIDFSHETLIYVRIVCVTTKQSISITPGTDITSNIHFLPTDLEA